MQSIVNDQLLKDLTWLVLTTPTLLRGTLTPYFEQEFAGSSNVYTLNNNIAFAVTSVNGTVIPCNIYSNTVVITQETATTNNIRIVGVYK